MQCLPHRLLVCLQPGLIILGVIRSPERSADGDARVIDERRDTPIIVQGLRGI
jgi:hypothetical protein